MNIVHVARTLDPAAGGPPQVAVRLAAAQATLGHAVHLISYSTTADQARVQQQLSRVPGHDLIQLHPLRDPGIGENITARQGRRLLQQLSRGADFVHIHGVWGALLRTAASVSRQASVPYCFRPAGMLDPWSLAQKRWKKRIALSLMYRRALAGSSFIHALNVDEKRLIEPMRLGVPAVVLPNGVFIEEIEPHPVRGTFRDAYPQLGSDPFILFLSRLHYKKGLDILATAFAALARKHQSVRLVVAGPDEGARESFLRQVSAAEIAARVHVVGPLYGADKYAALADAACFCLPSRQEGFSVAITEAMACAVPVVISNACHFPEVEKAGAGIVVPLQAEALTEGLLSILENPARASAMGSAGSKLVREQYTWNSIANQCIRVYQAARNGDVNHMVN